MAKSTEALVSISLSMSTKQRDCLDRLAAAADRTRSGQVRWILAEALAPELENDDLARRQAALEALGWNFAERPGKWSAEKRHTNGALVNQSSTQSHAALLAKCEAWHAAQAERRPSAPAAPKPKVTRGSTTAIEA